MKYELQIVNGVEPKCPNKKNTCERALCECDKAYAQSTYLFRELRVLMH